MPPRKRAETKPEPPVQEEAPAPDTVEAPAASEQGTPEVTPPEPDAADNDSPPADEKSSGEQPCSDCFPNGWPDGGTRVGCEHGNWSRD